MNLRAILLCLVLVAGVARAQDADCPPAITERLTEIRALLDVGSSKAALASLDELSSKLPGGCLEAARKVRIVTAELLVIQGRLTEADSILSEIEVGQLSAILERRFLYTRGSLLNELGLYHQARGEFEKAMRLSKEAGNQGQELLSQASMCSAQGGQAVGDSTSKAALLECFQELAERLDGTDLGAQEWRFAPVYLALGKLLGGESGRANLEKSLRLATAPPARITALGALALSRLDKDPAGATELLETALAEAESAYREQENVLPLLHLMASRHLVRWQALLREQALADSLAALDHIEKVRSQQTEPVTQAGFLSVWAEAYQRLAGQILRDAGDSPTSADLNLAFEILERYRARVLADSLDRPIPSSLNSISAALGEDEALLVFQLADWEDVFGRFEGGSWLFVVSRGGTRVYDLPGRSEFHRRIGMYNSFLGSRDDGEGLAAARLYRDLLATALDGLPSQIDKLILVPDGQLHLLPFGSLRAKPDDPPLARRYQMSTVPSASLWMRWRSEAPAESPRAALILANPRPAGVPAAALRAELGPLPFAAAEGRALFDRLGGELLLEGEASEASLKRRDLTQFGILHLAAHAVVDTVHPELSAVLLAQGEDQDGDLQARESAELALDGKLVVLSACRSATGTVLRGEGVMSLARSFFEAGASTVVGSLWPLDDWEAKQFFDAFYRHLEQGRTVQGALQRTQRDLRRAGQPAAAWAGVVVLGDGARTPLPTPARRLPAMLWPVLALIALAFSFGLWRHRRSHDSRPQD